MDQNSQVNRSGILNQVKENYGKLVYTYTTHLKAVKFLLRINNIIKWFLIVLTALTTGGLITIICVDSIKALEIVTAIITTITLALTSYQKSSSLDSRIVAHKQTANELWKLREEYLSFLTDFDSISDAKIIDKRDYLIEKLGNIYSHEPLTDSKAYSLAQKSLKTEEEQFFTPEELDMLLPKHLRNKQ